MTFDASKFLIKVQGGRTYLPVAARLVWFREDHADWGIVTEPLEINHEKQFAVFRASIFDADGKLMATATKKEDVKGFGDYIKKAETGSVGRALLLCGYGTENALDELDDGKNGDPAHIVDSPQQPRPAPRDNSPAFPSQRRAQPLIDAPIDIRPCAKCAAPISFIAGSGDRKPERFNADGGLHYLTCGKQLTGYENQTASIDDDPFAGN